MNMFERIMKELDLKCDICGSKMLVMYGCGWDNDRIVCSDGRSCGAEIEFPTSTIQEEEAPFKSLREQISDSYQKGVEEEDKESNEKFICCMCRRESDIANEQLIGDAQFCSNECVNKFLKFLHKYDY